MIPATLTDADLSTILDGCYTERMELVARIRGKPGLCPQGEVQGKEILCRSPDGCEYQCWNPGTTEPTYCGREAAVLASLEQQAPEDLPPAMPAEGGTDVMK